MDTTFYYATTPDQMFHLREQITIWMPEHLPADPSIWNANQIIATCDLSYLFRVRDRIQAGTLAPKNVIWIEIKNHTATGYIFGADGKIANFFRVI